MACIWMEYNEISDAFRVRVLNWEWKRHPYIERLAQKDLTELLMHWNSIQWDHLSKYGVSHCKNKTVMGPSHLYNGYSCAGKTTPSNWNISLGVVFDLGKFANRSFYRNISNIRHTKSQNLNVSRFFFQLSLCNLVKPGVKSRMKM